MPPFSQTTPQPSRATSPTSTPNNRQKRNVIWRNTSLNHFSKHLLCTTQIFTLPKYLHSHIVKHNLPIQLKPIPKIL
ncbi:hypothetical protein Hanom_Chr11g01043441 [Helianthus anomalus]